MKTLLVLRHAKSSWNDSSLDDRERPLNARGRGDAPRVGDLLRGKGLTPDLIITSDAVRAHTTAQAVSEAAGVAADILVDPRLYLAGPQDIIAVLQSVADDNVRIVLLVGHNPGLEELVAQLTGVAEDLPTAALVKLTVPIETWAELSISTGATLVDIWRPK